MSFSAMNGMVSTIFEQLSKRCNLICVWNIRCLSQSVYIPFRKLQDIALHVGRGILSKSPVCNTMTCSIHSSHEACSSGRAYTTCIGLSKHLPLRCQSLHIRSMIPLVEVSFLFPERQ